MSSSYWRMEVMIDQQFFFTISVWVTVLFVCAEGQKAKTSTPSSHWGCSESCGRSKPLNGFPSWRCGNPVLIQSLMHFSLGRNVAQERDKLIFPRMSRQNLFPFRWKWNTYAIWQLSSPSWVVSTDTQTRSISSHLSCQTHWFWAKCVLINDFMLFSLER